MKYYFFWTDNLGRLKIKHIDFLEFFPFNNGDLVYHDYNGLNNLADFIFNYKIPKYQVELHKKLNEFIELINLPDTLEPQITKYLEQNPEVLQFSFDVYKLNPQVQLEWQYDTERNNLKPDFMPERMDGVL